MTTNQNLARQTFSAHRLIYKALEISAEDLKRPIDDATQKKIDKLVSQGYTIVDKFDLTDGDYLEDWSGYYLTIKNLDGTPTGYQGITYDGLKGVQKDKKTRDEVS